MKTKFNAQSIKDNAQHIAGIIVGLTALKLTGLRYSKAERGTKWFSIVAANLAADGAPLVFAPFAMFYRVPA